MIVLLEHAVKGPQAVETAIEGNLGYRAVAALQPFAGKGPPIEHQKLQKGRPRNFPHTMGKIIFRITAMGSDFISNII